MSSNSVIIPHGAGDPVDVTIASHNFWPELSSNDFRNIMRVGGTIPNTRVEATLIAAVIAVNKELQKFRLTWALYAGLEDIPADQVAGISIYVHQYQAAVFNNAKADLVERYRDFDSTNDGHDEADKLEETIDDYRRKSRENIRALLGNPRTTIELL